MRKFAWSALLLVGLLLPILLIACGEAEIGSIGSVPSSPGNKVGLEPVDPEASSEQSDLDAIASAAISSKGEYEVLPKTTDGAIDQWPAPHLVAFNSTLAAKGKLFVHLVGSYGKPSSSHLLLQQAAANGYHAINLSYPNSWTVAQLCQRDPDQDCTEKVRLEILDGTDRTNKVTINRANSIENRLIKLLVYLHKQKPNEGWDQYLENNGTQLKWSALTISGHSQGGGHAALIGKQHNVARVVMFGAPNDSSPRSKGNAPWVSKPSATPADRYYAFSHSQDPGFDNQQQAWNIMKLPGVVTNVDGQKIPFGQSHKLTTKAIPATSGEYHGSVVVDRNVPKLPDGTSLFKEVWQYLCFT